MPTILQGTFSTRNEKGQSRQIREFLRMVDASQLTGLEPIHGMKQLKTASGWSVTPLGDGKYRVVESGELLTADDPSRN